ncbi:hypothetical protein [Dendronalium sp. ChiSLP03b]|uniref:hypothetical protein n=1 Tax=Dendronalium sp. ChiSLP03b TaxID=3075381 RepID=UPI00391A39F4
MLIRVKVSKAFFNKVQSNEWIDGLFQGNQGCWVYVELGEEYEYISSPKDDPKTEYRIFRGCDVFYADSLENLENEKYLGSAENQTVIIYC